MKANGLIKRTNYLIFIVVMLYTVSQLLLHFIVGDEWVERHYYLFLIFVQLVVITLPVLIFTYRHNLNPMKAFRIKKITVMEGLLIVMMAVASSLIASVLNAVVIFFLEQLGTVPSEGFSPAGSIPELWIQIGVIAFLPAMCEELFFRGIIWNAYESFGVRWSMVISAGYFALFHFDLRNLLGPFFLGLLIAWYCYRTGSVFAGILAHFTNNALAVLVNWFNRDVILEQADLTHAVMGQMFVLACVVGCILVILLKAFNVLTSKKSRFVSDWGIKPSLTLVVHWPMWFFYAVYLIIAVRLFSVITRPLI